MKDERLEQQFKEYFDGVDVPELPNNIVADAKKSVKRRESRLPRFAKIASIAASFVLVFAVAAVVIARTDFSAFAPDAPGASQIKTYGVADVEHTERSAYELSSFDKSLKFVENLAYLPQADVKTAVTYNFAGGEKAFAYAEVTLISGARYDAEIYVEFAQDTFEPLKDYAGGTSGTYLGISYRLTKEIADNGEPVNKLLVERGGVKYYFNVQSSDENSYLKCIELLLQN